MKRVINRKSTYEYGNYKEIEIYPVYSGSHQKLRGEKAKRSKKSQRELNRKNRIKKIFRLLNANFTGKDYFLTLTYSDRFIPKTVEELEKDYRRVMQKIRKEYNRLGLELKYMSWIEKGVEKGRIHHHIVLSGGLSDPMIFFDKIFKKGFADVKLLRPWYNDLKDLAEYFAKDPKGKRTFTCSKNLDRSCLTPKKIENNRTNKHEIKKIAENYDDKDFFEQK